MLFGLSFFVSKKQTYMNFICNLENSGVIFSVDILKAKLKVSHSGYTSFFLNQYAIPELIE